MARRLVLRIVRVRHSESIAMWNLDDVGEDVVDNG